MAPAPIRSGDGKKYKLKDLKALGHQLLSSRAHINNLPLLLTFVTPSSPPQHVLESVLSLQSFFTPFIPDLPPPPSASSSLKGETQKDPELIYRTWLRSKFDEFVRSLIDIVASSEAEDTLKEIVFDTIMEFVKLGKGGSFQSAIYHRLIHSIVNMPADIDLLLELLSSKYFKYIDICYFTYISLEKLIQKLEPKVSTGNIGDGDGRHPRASSEHSIHRVHRIMSHIPPLGCKDNISDSEMWSGSELNAKETSGLSKADGKQLKSEKNANVLSAAKIAKKIRLKFTKAWLSFLRLPLPLDVYKEVLVNLHQAVIPYLSNPIMLCDFLTRSYDIGGVVSVLALSSLFILMTQHGLEYPNFYEKLYALLQPSIFMAKHRAKFLELLDSCLKSHLLPAYLAAAFAKKLSRMALSVPPSGALMIIALIHNLLRRHPSINCLVHKQEDGDTAANEQAKVEKDIPGSEKDDSSDVSKKLGFDHFRDEEVNPIKANAMRSSLWEIDSLRHHYCPPVSRFVLSLENDLTVRAKTTEINVKDFSSGSYATIFGDEMRRRVKQVPLAFYKATPSSLFSESDFPGWTFQYENGEEKNIVNDNSGCGTTTDIIPEEQNELSAKRQRVECSS
ncbi:nucleolar complex protein 4 homolog isoform X2 [Punica granatum]|uniref:Nucleolar complex protein 4 homolog isoform X2 n=1 Tax=Punica granatum TaxID=22663 RepID=A0A6P8D1L2_PUNGR|nr:nucleolar complex protein 4 homolog isoform X2 [Punica granatum]